MRLSVAMRLFSGMRIAYHILVSLYVVCAVHMGFRTLHSVHTVLLNSVYIPIPI